MSVSLEQAIKDVNKKIFKSNDKLVAYGDEVEHRDFGRIPFTSPRLNYMFYGGLPRGRVHEFFGMENGGKTTTALDLTGQAQKLFQREYDEGKSPVKQHALWVDVEQCFDDAWATLLGVNVPNLIIMQPEEQPAEIILEGILELMRTGEIGFACLDSIAGMMSIQEMEKKVEEKTYAGIAAPLTVFSRKIVSLCAKYNITFIGINQLREDLGNPYGGTKTPGGKGFKFFSSVRTEIRKGKLLDNNGNEVKNSTGDPAGNKIELGIVKTKSFKPNRKTGFYSLNYSKGIWTSIDLVEVGLLYNAIIQEGSWFKFKDLSTGEFVEENGAPFKIQGKANIATYLDEDEWMRNFINAQINYAMENNT